MILGPLLIFMGSNTDRTKLNLAENIVVVVLAADSQKQCDPESLV